MEGQAVLKAGMGASSPAFGKYRPEIDGLRSVAVIAVILFHYGVPGLSGGFIGVDIFFVISGFLIGSILWSEQRSTGTIGLANFYAKRIRRIAPAFFTVTSVVTVFAIAILLPFDLREFGKELLSSSLYVSNVYFFLKTGYFETAAEQKLLLHTWSLSVEEQFYIVLPVLLLAAARFVNTLFGLVATLTVLSFVACVAATYIAPEAAFFLFPFRAWELLAGVTLGIWSIDRGFTFSIHPLASWVGALIVVTAVVVIEPGRNFPGLWALLPVIGSILIIANGRDPNPVNALLASPPAVFVGLLSYSLYLWHWPVLILTRYYFGEHLSGLAHGACLLATCALSWATWRYIEVPVRQREIVSIFRFVGAGCAVSLAFVAAGGLLFSKDGFPGRFSDDTAGHIAATQDFLQDWSRCSNATQGPLQSVDVCQFGPSGSEPSVLVWGDSHVRAFKEGLALAADEAGVSGLLVWTAGCPPLFGIEKVESAATAAEDAACTRINSIMAKALPELPSIKSVLLIGRWSYYVEGQGTGLDANNKITVRAISSQAPTSTKPASILEAAMARTAQAFAANGKRVFLLQQTPEIANYDSRLFARRLAQGHALDEAPALSATINRSAAEQRSGQSRDMIRRLASQLDIRIIDPWPELCNESQCSAIKDGQPIYFDNNHITNTGARALRHLFTPVFSYVRKTSGNLPGTSDERHP